MVLPFINGRAISWLIPIDGSVNSDNRSQHSLNLNEIKPNSNNKDDLNNDQYSSMQSISSTGSSNNENYDQRVVGQRFKLPNGNQQIYDTLNNRKANKNRQAMPLK